MSYVLELLPNEQRFGKTVAVGIKYFWQVGIITKVPDNLDLMTINRISIGKITLVFLFIVGQWFNIPLDRIAYWPEILCKLTSQVD